MAFADKQRKATYQCFMDMKQRCQNHNHKYYSSYGGRGIDVCNQWQTFDHFIQDMGLKPDGLSLDRIDNDLGYSKENCRWATKAEQVRNTRRTGNPDVGVRYSSKFDRWSAQIKVNGKTIMLGFFNNLDDARNARKQGEVKYWERILKK